MEHGSATEQMVRLDVPLERDVFTRTLVREMCMTTSNVFGSIAARNLGYARVELQETMATGAPGCRVVLHLRPTAEAAEAPGREYFGDGSGPE
jgi:hypothetical protein